MKTDLTGYPAHGAPPGAGDLLPDRRGGGRLRCRHHPAELPDGADRAGSGAAGDVGEPQARATTSILVKALINLIGIYPVGTCVILDTFEVAIVAAARSRRAAAQPAAGARRGRRRRRDRAAAGQPGEPDRAGRGRQLPALDREGHQRRHATASPSATTLSESAITPDLRRDLRARGAHRARSPTSPPAIPTRARAERRSASRTSWPTSSRSACRSATRSPTGLPSSARRFRRSSRA